MKRKIEFYQKYITKLKALVEEDRGVADLFTHLRNNESVEDGGLDDLHGVTDDQFAYQPATVNDGGYRVEDLESRQINIEANRASMD